MKLFKAAISHNDSRCDVCYEDADHFNDIPDELITKAHGVCFWNDQLLLVHHPKWDIWGIPGGTREENESILETLVREIKEETNCKVLDCVPIGYHKIIGPDNDVHYRAQYMCIVEPIGEFESDPAGNIAQIMWINPETFKDHIEKKEFKEIVIERALTIRQNNL